MEKIFKSSLFLIFILSSTYCSADEYNPFVPKILEPIEIDKKKEYVPPLIKWDLFQYDLIGVVLTDHKSIGLIKTPAGEIYNVENGMELGINGYKIVDIFIDRLVLNKKKVKNILILKNHEL